MSSLKEKRQTKARLLEATIELALEHGLGAVSLGDVALKVGIRKPSIYNHYASKSELLEGVFEHMRALQPRAQEWLPESLLAKVPELSCQEVLIAFADHYEVLMSAEDLAKRHKLLHSEKYFSSAMNGLAASDIECMTQAVKVLLETMMTHGRAGFSDIQLAAESFVYAFLCLSSHEHRRSYAARYAKAHLVSSAVVATKEMEPIPAPRRTSGILWKGRSPENL